MKQTFSGKIIGICFLLSIVGYLLFPVTYGGVFGCYLANKLGGDQRFLKEVESTYENPPITGELYRKEAFKKMLKEELTTTDKLTIVVSASAVTFTILGLIAGFFTRQWLAPVIIPLLVLPLSLRVLKAPLLIIENPITTTMVGIVTQIIAVCTTAYFGDLLRGKVVTCRQRKKTPNSNI